MERRAYRNVWTAPYLFSSISRTIPFSTSTSSFFTLIGLQASKVAIFSLGNFEIRNDCRDLERGAESGSMLETLLRDCQGAQGYQLVNCAKTRKRAPGKANRNDFVKQAG